MPRRKGLHQSTYFHVFNRGVDRQDIFTDHRDHECFEDLLRLMVEETGVRVHAYSLMTNHYHGVVEAVGEQLSDGMYLLGKNYALEYNRSVGRSGPLCTSRFESIPITSPEMLMVEGRYVHRNPIDIVGLGGLAGYRYSSLPAYLGARRPAEWLTCDTLLAAHGDDASRYKAFVERDHPTDSQAVGRRPALHPATLDDVEEALGGIMDVDVDDLSRTRRGRRNDARLAVCTVAVELRVAPTEVIAGRLGFPDQAAVRAAASRGRALRHRDPCFDELCRVLSSRTTRRATAA